MQAVWDRMLDEDFVHAYLYGQRILFPDGVERLVFPRIFAYSADYPEKFVLSSFLRAIDNTENI